MRRAHVALAIWLVFLSLAGTGEALAQEPAPLTLRLVRQTPWTTADEPQLTFRIRATNDGAARMGDLTVVVTVGQAIDSREEYWASLTDGPSDGTVAADRRWEATIEPGASRTATFALDFSSVATVRPDDSGVYPMRIEVLRGGAPAGSLITPAIHLVREPEAPVGLAWWLELARGPAFDPEGRLADVSIEGALGSGGSLGAPVSALSVLDEPGARSTGATVVIQPSLVDEVRRMARGYTRVDGTRVRRADPAASLARDWLAALREAVARPRTSVVALPYAAPPLPAMLESGLDADLERQERTGVALIRQALRVEPAAAALRPPGGLLDDATLARAAAAGTTVVLGDADEIERPPQENDFAPPGVATLADLPGVSFVLPDPSTQALIGSTEQWADPVLASQAVLGQLAAIWREQPVPGPQEDGTPTHRGIALALPPDLPAAAWHPLVRRLAQAPFLAPMEASELAAYVTPVTEASELASPDEVDMAPEIAASVPELHADVETFASMLTEPSTEPADLQRSTMLSTWYWDDPLGAAPWTTSVRARTDEVFASTEPEVDQVFTFTSGEGTIPLVMGDPGDTPLRVSVEMRSDRFTFPDGSRQEVVLSRPNQILRFRVVASGAGQDPIDVVVLSPSGAETSRETIVVRSTALNRVALWITVAAAVILGLRWARRWTRRTPAA